MVSFFHGFRGIENPPQSLDKFSKYRINGKTNYVTLTKCPPSLLVDILNHFESMDIYYVCWFIQPWSHMVQRVSEEKDMDLPKVLPSQICTTSVKFPSRGERGFKGLNWIRQNPLVGLYPLYVSHSKFDEKIRTPW